MKYLLAIDSFKGCLSSAEVEETIAEALRKQGADVTAIPLSDGGEGMLEAFTHALNGTLREVSVHDPLMRSLTARYGVTAEGMAIVETSQACGLTLMTEAERNPMIATTYGVGEMVAHAILSGCRQFIIGLGGSGTSECGIGMLQALTERLAGGRSFDAIRPLLEDCRFTLASDVRNVLYGEQGAAYTFGRQKGATDDMIRVLDERARQFAESSASHWGFDKSSEPGAGAAGGLGYAFMQYLGAKAVSGADLLLDLVRFDKQMEGTDVVITGEGRADRQTLMGKLPERVLCRAKAQHIPVWLMAGRIADREALLDAGFEKVEAITPEEMPTSEAILPATARRNLTKWIERTTTFGRQPR